MMSDLLETSRDMFHQFYRFPLDDMFRQAITSNHTLSPKEFSDVRAGIGSRTAEIPLTAIHRNKTFPVMTGFDIPVDGSIDSTMKFCNDSLLLGRRKLSADEQFQFSSNWIRSQSFSHGAGMLTTSVIDGCHSTWSNRNGVISVCPSTNFRQSNQDSALVINKERMSSESTPQQPQGLLKSILLDHNIPDIYRNRPQLDWCQNIATTRDEALDFSYERRRLHSLPLKTVGAYPAMVRQDSPVSSLTGDKVVLNDQPLCLSMKKRKFLTENEIKRSETENFVEVGSHSHEAEVPRDRKFSFSIMYSLLTQTESELPTAEESIEKSENYTRTGRRTMSENLSLSQFRQRSGTVDKNRQRAATWSEKSAPYSLPRHSNITQVYSNASGHDAIFSQPFYSSSSSFSSFSSSSSDGCDANKHPTVYQQCIGQKVNKRVAIPKELASLVDFKVKNWLKDINSLIKNYEKSTDLSSHDRKSLLCNAASRLLLLFVAEDNFQFAVQQVDESEEMGEMEKSGNLSISELPTIQSVEEIRRFIARCQSMKISAMEYHCMRLISLFHTGCPGLQQTHLIEQINSNACKILTDISRKSRPNEKLRYLEIILVLRTLFGINSRMVQELLCRQSLTIADDHGLTLLKDTVTLDSPVLMESDQTDQWVSEFTDR